MTFEQLQQLWIAQGGNPAYAPIMAAIAMAESSGDVTNTTGDNGTSYGLWQIHWPVHPQFDPSQLTNAQYNANAAIQLSGNGAGEPWAQGTTDWTTWNDYVRGLTGTNGYQVISKYLGPWSGTLPLGAAGAGSSSSSTSTPSSSSGPSSPAWLQSLGSLPFGIGPGAESVVSSGIVLSGAIALLLIGGLWLILGNSGTRTIVVNTGKTVGKAAAAIAT